MSLSPGLTPSSSMVSAVAEATTRVAIRMLETVVVEAMN
jgi:hypothetical protein